MTDRVRVAPGFVRLVRPCPHREAQVAEAAL